MLYNPNVSAFGETNQQNFYNYDIKRYSYNWIMRFCNKMRNAEEVTFRETVFLRYLILSSYMLWCF